MRNASICLLLTFLLSTEVYSQDSTNNIPHIKPIRFIIPAATFGLALHFRHQPIFITKYKLQEEIKDDIFSWYDYRADNYFQFLPSISPFILDLFKVPSYHTKQQRNLVILEAHALTLLSAFILKKTTHDIRPDGSNDLSFPSGHTAMVFTGAAILGHEYGKKYPWIKWTGYGVAALVGLSRIANNKHWASDVVGGASLAILDTEIIYWLNRKKLSRSVNIPQKL